MFCQQFERVARSGRRFAAARSGPNLAFRQPPWHVARSRTSEWLGGTMPTVSERESTLSRPSAAVVGRRESIHGAQNRPHATAVGICPECPALQAEPDVDGSDRTRPGRGAGLTGRTYVLLYVSHDHPSPERRVCSGDPPGTLGWGSSALGRRGRGGIGCGPATDPGTRS